MAPSIYNSDHESSGFPRRILDDLTPQGKRTTISATSLAASRPVAPRANPKDDMTFNELEHLVKEERELKLQGKFSMERFLYLLQRPKSDWEPLMTDGHSVVYSLGKNRQDKTKDIFASNTNVYQGFTVVEGISPRQAQLVIQHPDLWDDWHVDGQMLHALTMGDQKVFYETWKPPKKNPLYNKMKLRDVVVIDRTLVSRRMILPSDDPRIPVRTMDQIADPTILYCRRSVKSMNLPPQQSKIRVDIGLAAWKLDAVNLKNGGVGTSIAFYFELNSAGPNMPQSAFNYYASRRCFITTTLKKYFIKYGLKPVGVCIERNNANAKKAQELQQRVRDRYKEHHIQFEESLMQHTRLMNSIAEDSDSKIKENRRLGMQLENAPSELKDSKSFNSHNMDENDAMWRYPSGANSPKDTRSRIDSKKSSTVNEAVLVAPDGFKASKESISLSQLKWEVGTNHDLVTSEPVSRTNSINGASSRLNRGSRGSLLVNTKKVRPISSIHSSDYPRPSTPKLVSKVNNNEEEHISDLDVSMAIKNESSLGSISFLKRESSFSETLESESPLYTSSTIDIADVSHNHLEVPQVNILDTEHNMSRSFPSTPNNTGLNEHSNIQVNPLAAFIHPSNSARTSVFEEETASERDVIIDTSHIPVSTIASTHALAQDIHRIPNDKNLNEEEVAQLDELSRKYSTVRLGRKKTLTNTPKLDTIFAVNGTNDSGPSTAPPSLPTEHKVETLTRRATTAKRVAAALAAEAALAVGNLRAVTSQVLMPAKKDKDELKNITISIPTSRNIPESASTATEEDEQITSPGLEYHDYLASPVIFVNQNEGYEQLEKALEEDPNMPHVDYHVKRPEDANTDQEIVKMGTLKRSRKATLSRYDGMNANESIYCPSVSSMGSYRRTLTIGGISIQEDLYGPQRCRVDPFLPIISQAYSWRHSPIDVAISQFQKGLIGKNEGYRLFISQVNDNPVVKCTVPKMYTDINDAIQVLHRLTNETSGEESNKVEWTKIEQFTPTLKTVIDTLENVNVSFTEINGIHAIKVDVAFKTQDCKKYCYVPGEARPTIPSLINTVSNPQARQLWDTTIRASQEEFSKWDKIKALTMGTQSAMNSTKFKEDEVKRTGISTFASKSVSPIWHDIQTFTASVEAETLRQYDTTGEFESLIMEQQPIQAASPKSPLGGNSPNQSQDSIWTEDNSEMNTSPVKLTSPTINGIVSSVSPTATEFKSEPINITTFTGWNNNTSSESMYAIDMIADSTPLDGAHGLYGAWVASQSEDNSDVVQLSRIQILPKSAAVNIDNIEQPNFSIAKLLRLFFDLRSHLKLTYMGPMVPYVSVPTNLTEDENEQITSTPVKDTAMLKAMVYGVSGGASHGRFIDDEDADEQDDQTGQPPEFTSWSLMYTNGIPSFIGDIQQMTVLSTVWDTAHRVFTSAVQGTSGSISFVLPRYPLDVQRRNGMVTNVTEPSLISSQLDYFNVSCDGCVISSVKPKLRIDVSSFGCPLLYVNIVDTASISPPHIPIRRLASVDAADSVVVTLHIPAENQGDNKGDSNGRDNRGKGGINNEELHGSPTMDSYDQHLSYLNEESIFAGNNQYKSIPTEYNAEKLFKHGLKKRIGVRIEYLGIVVEHKNLETQKIHTHEYLRNPFEAESENDPCCIFWPFE